MSEWQPIETAPKDGTVIDLWVKNLQTWDKRGHRMVNSSWRTVQSWYGQEYENWTGCGDVYEPTHWMPLPPPPEVK